MARHRMLSEESGFALIEVMVSAALLAVIVTGLLGAFDGSSKVSGAIKARAIAASIAQDDQERLRSLPVAQLSNMRTAPYPVVVEGITYSVTSRADWIADASSTTSCASNGAAADYLRITSTVAPPTAVNIKPVTVVSLVTPSVGTFGPTQGSLAVRISDRADGGVPGVPVTISGPATASDTSDANGCLFFGYMPAGNYTLSAARVGYVDPDGNSTYTKTVTVAAQQVSTMGFQLDLAGSVNVRFTTTPASAPAKAGTATFVNTGSTVGRIKKGDGTPASSITAANLFPFTSVYNVYAGDCTAADPTAQKDPATTAAKPQAVDTIKVMPGDLGRPLSVFLPPLTVTVTGATAAADVYVTATASGCTQARTLLGTTSGGTLVAGVPYGTYTVCAQIDGKRSRQTSVPVTTRAGHAVTLANPTNNTPC
jgi:Tfp pilus assembly protein PilV